MNNTTNTPTTARQFASTKAAADLLDRLDLVGLVAALDTEKRGTRAQEAAFRILVEEMTGRTLSSLGLDPIAAFVTGASLWAHDDCADCDELSCSLYPGETEECDACGATVGDYDADHLARFCSRRGWSWFEFTTQLLTYDTVQVVDAVLHETAHAVVYLTDWVAHAAQADHGPAFKEAARKLGAQPRASLRRDLRALDPTPTAKR